MFYKLASREIPLPPVILFLRKLSTLKPRHSTTGTDLIRYDTIESQSQLNYYPFSTLSHPVLLSLRLFFISEGDGIPGFLSGNSLSLYFRQFLSLPSTPPSFLFFPSSYSRAITMQLPFMEPTLHSSVSFPTLPSNAPRSRSFLIIS